MDKILLMLQLQNSLNDATNGDTWTEGVTKNHKTINWRRCIYMECGSMWNTLIRIIPNSY